MAEESVDISTRLERRVVQGVPTIQDIRDLALKTQSEQIEYGVSVYQTVSAETGSVYAAGSSRAIFEPEPPKELKGKIRSGVFIHCHPIALSERVENGRSLHLLPSGSNSLAGDFGADIMSRIIGGYLNVASEYGLTMNIGIEGITREDFITRELKRKAGADKTANEHVWKIWSGNKAGTAFVNREIGEAVDQKFSVDEDIILLSHTDSLGTRNFLHLSWEKLTELESIYGGFENLCFGNGLDLLLNHLAIDVKHDKNLGEAAQTTYALPQKRGEKENS